MCEAVSHREFVELLWRAFLGGRKEWADGMEAALRHGWLQPQDLAVCEEPIRRNSAARILHEFLLRELGEADASDWSKAKELKDLYDCRTCVNHVAQTVCKGIMLPDGLVFGMQRTISRREAKEMIERALTPRKRVGVPKCKMDAGSMPKAALRVTKEEAQALLQSGERLSFYDVRTKGEYDRSHLEGARNLPLLRLLTDPKLAGEDKDALILLGCDGGYRSEMAANCLAQAGFRRVRYFGWEEMSCAKDDSLL
ncbi:MAG: rhodanese-like domain-containing protein [Lachnospiraceae bacterium]|nr:rhodanese-like domain-containing protein [Lachnospiraceae bacterium]